MPINRKYGRIKDARDNRDRFMLEAPLPLSQRPAVASLRPLMPPIYNQASLGSCTGNGGARIMQYRMSIQNLTPVFQPSRLGIYYDERVEEGTVDDDSGAQIRTCIKVMARYGVFPEELWPYDVSKFKIQPPESCYDVAKHHKALEYARVPQTRELIETCIVQKNPIIFGFEVFPGFESDEVAETGMVPLPKQGETPVGGHCTVAIGYDRARDLIECDNSWGEDWGDEGRFWLPGPFFRNSNLTSDLWKVTLIAA